MYSNISNKENRHGCSSLLALQLHECHAELKPVNNTNHCSLLIRIQVEGDNNLNISIDENSGSLNLLQSSVAKHICQILETRDGNHTPRYSWKTASGDQI